MTTSPSYGLARAPGADPTTPAEPALLRPLLRLDLAFNAVLALVLLTNAASVATAGRLTATWPVLVLAAACVENTAVMWVGARTPRPTLVRRMTRLSAAIDLTAAAAIGAVALAGPAGMARWVALTAGAIGLAAVPVAVLKLVLAGRTATGRC